MSRQIFVDTGAWFALTDKRDQYHPAVKSNYRRLWENYSQWVTTNLVIVETFSLIRYRGSYKLAMDFLQSVGDNQRVVKVYVTADIDNQAEAILRQYADQDFSFIDAVSFAVMRQRGIETAFAFDHHFLVAGFSLTPTISP